MKRFRKDIRIGILGCGAIGSGIAKSTLKELKGLCRLSGLYDVDEKKATALAKSFKDIKLKKTSLTDLIRNCDLMVEAVNAPTTRPFIRQALLAKRHVLAMSVGKLLNAKDLFTLASKSGASLLVPSGAIAGVDAIKAASLVPVSRITLTTRKPPESFRGVKYISDKGIDLNNIKEDTTLFEGGVDEAVKHFPQNINVAATLALASQSKEKITVRIVASPTCRTNSHEIEMTGDFGRLVTLTENRISPDNPKTSYLAILSGIQTLKNFCSGVSIGT